MEVKTAGRPREFDLEEALDSAMTLFWERGYGATSVADLVEAIGITRSSIYQAFGSKPALFVAVLARYSAVELDRLTAALRRPEAGVAAVEAFFSSLVDHLASPRGRCGCLVTNTATELAATDPSVRHRVAELIVALETALRQCLTVASANGELAAGTDLAALARYLTAVAQGLQVLAKTQPGESYLRDVATVALASIPRTQRPRHGTATERTFPVPTKQLSELTMLDPETAPPREKAVLEQARQGAGGRLPHMYAYMANSPGLLETYLGGYARFREESGFTPAEQEVVFLTISRLNGCEYCMAAHSTLASGPSRVDRDVIEAIRNGDTVPDSKLQTLVEFVGAMFTTRGRPESEDVERFLAAGFSERQMLEIVLALAVKTLSNYVNHLADTPVDEMFAQWEWRAEPS